MEDHIYCCDPYYKTPYQGKSEKVHVVRPLHLPFQYSSGDPLLNLKLLCDLSLSKPVIDPFLDTFAEHGVCFTQNAVFVLQMIVHICMYSYMPPKAYSEFLRILVREINLNILNPIQHVPGITHHQQNSFSWILIHSNFIWPLFITKYFTRSFK
jgi:hypothetical protein